MSRGLSVFVLSAILCACAAAQAPITLVTEEWPPYNYTEAGALKGFAADLLASMLRMLGQESRVSILPGSRAKDVLDRGGRVIYISMFRTAEREALYKWVGPIDEAAFHFYKKRGNPLAIGSLDDARRAASISCRNTGLVYSFLDSEGFTNLDTSSNPGGIYLKVLNGRCDLAIGETPLGVVYILKQLGFPGDSLEESPLGILGGKLYIACSRDIPDGEVERWQAVLDSLKASGEYGKLRERYLR